LQRIPSLRTYLPPWALILAALAGPGLPAAAPRPAAAEEYEVLRAYLTSPYVEKVDFSLYEKIGIFFIYNVDPKKPESISGFFQQYANTSLSPELVRAFVAANRTPRAVDRKLFPANYRYSSQYIKQDAYSLSRVGFNARRDEALMYASFSSLLEDGHGALVYLRKAGGAWSVVKSSAVWMYGASVHPFQKIGP